MTLARVDQIIAEVGTDMAGARCAFMAAIDSGNKIDLSMAQSEIDAAANRLRALSASVGELQNAKEFA